MGLKMSVSSTVVAFVVFTLFACGTHYYASACYGPAVVGPCKASFTRWYFNATTGKCYKFIYGGCRGSSNNFKTKIECLRACSKSHPPKSVCEKKPDPGPCKASFPAWYFDSETGYCRRFVYGGCKGNGNRFPTCSKCMQACGKPGSKQKCKKFSPK
uniref:BPTI/Kunitz inhibitor domain-containing protein n=1 Tax=Amblyomma triste TaxID=251400 RepID=A0A023GCE3_AMBTT